MDGIGLSLASRFGQHICSVVEALVPSPNVFGVCPRSAADVEGSDPPHSASAVQPAFAFSVTDWTLLLLAASVIVVWLRFRWSTASSSEDNILLPPVAGPRTVSPRRAAAPSRSGYKQQSRYAHDSDTSEDPPTPRPSEVDAHLGARTHSPQLASGSTTRRIPDPPKRQPPPRAKDSPNTRPLTVPRREGLPEKTGKATSPLEPPHPQQEPPNRRPRGTSRVLLRRIVEQAQTQHTTAGQIEHEAPHHEEAEVAEEKSGLLLDGSNELTANAVGEGAHPPPDISPVSPMQRQCTEPPQPHDAEPSFIPCSEDAAPLRDVVSHVAVATAATRSPSQPHREDSALRALANDRPRHHCPVLGCWLANSGDEPDPQSHTFGPLVARLVNPEDLDILETRLSKPRCWKCDGALMEGDVILAVNGRRTLTVAQVQAVILDIPRGQHLIALTILRPSRAPEADTTLVPSEQPHSPSAPKVASPSPTMLILPVRQPHSRFPEESPDPAPQVSMGGE